MDNKQIVTKCYEDFKNGNFEDFFAAFDENVDWKTQEINGTIFDGKRKGRESVCEFFDLVSEHQDFLSFEPKEFISENNKVVVVGHGIIGIKATERKLETDWVHIFTLNDGKVTDFLELFDTAAMKRAYQASASA